MRVVEPRYAWAPPAVRGFGRECCDWYRAHGGSLLDWQEDAVVRMLGVDGGDRFASSDDGVCVCRQNGKGEILIAVEAFVAFEFGQAFGYDLITHTAHEVPTALEHQRRLEDFIRSDEELNARVSGYLHANGQESIRLKDGTRIIFKARTRGSGRGYSGDLLVWDEAMVIPDHVIGAQKPTTRASSARYGQKTIYAGSAVDQVEQPYGRQFALIRQRGIEQHPRVSWTEYSAAFDHPDEVSFDEMQNRDHWYAGNPSMGHLIREETMQDEVDTIPKRVALVELFGVGDWPDPSNDGDRVISLEAWDSLMREDSELQLPYVLAFDVSPARKLAVAIAGRNQREKFHVEIQEFRDGTQWFTKWLIGVWQRNGENIYSIVCDGVGPAASLIGELEEAGIPVDTMTSSEHAESCGRFVDLVGERGVEHLGSSELREAISGAATRPLGDRFAWARKSSRADISPLVAATLALGAAAGISVGEVMIY